jgi:hypothetical protein
MISQKYRKIALGGKNECSAPTGMIFMRFTVFHFSLCRAGGWMEASSNMMEDFSILKNPS